LLRDPLNLAPPKKIGGSDLTLEDGAGRGETELSQLRPGAGPPPIFDRYARERIIVKCADLIEDNPGYTWSYIADDITRLGIATFHREYFSRLRNHTLSDPLVDAVVRWIELKHDKRFREKLTPASIFAELGVNSRDYYFHLPWANTLEEWDEQLLDEFAGVYICAPAEDAHSYLPAPRVRATFANWKNIVREDRQKRSPNLETYLRNRSILILKRTPTAYFHAAEFPLSMILPPSFPTNDIKTVFEGVAVASANSIHIFMRECLSRVPKIHSLLLAPKDDKEHVAELGISMHVWPGMEFVRKEWETLSDIQLAHFRREFAKEFEAPTYITGSAQVHVSPIPYTHNWVQMSFAQTLLYQRKPRDFLRQAGTHLIEPSVADPAAIERLIENPLAIGELK
jgi:hypothetical protein